MRRRVAQTLTAVVHWTFWFLVGLGFGWSIYYLPHYLP